VCRQPGDNDWIRPKGFVGNVKDTGMIARQKERLKAGDGDKLYRLIDEMRRVFVWPLVFKCGLQRIRMMFQSRRASISSVHCELPNLEVAEHVTFD